MNRSKELYLEKLERFLKRKLPLFSDLKDSIPYSVFPAGKAFRPLLCLNIAHDLKIENEKEVHAIAHFCELHHAYSLIHDDLPAMDNDDYRRGRLSTHKKFNEANAILSGDALINLSYEALSETNNIEIIKFCTWAVGPKGLILGQELDLNSKVESLKDVILIHKLKTSRLIQAAMVSTILLAPKKKRLFLDIFQAAEDLGIIFQLLDDLSELSEDISDHELEINPYLRFESEEILETVQTRTLRMRKIFDKHQLENTKNFVDTFLIKSQKNLLESQDQIEKVIKKKVTKISLRS